MAAKEGRGTAEGGAAGRAMSSLSSCPDPNPDQSELCCPCLTCHDGWFPWQPDVCCLEAQHGERRSFDNLFGSPGFRTDPLRQPDSLGLHSTIITGLLPASVNAIRRSSDIVCDP